MMNTRRAFTLIELLVVISVIALLMGILMPVLHRAREAGARAVCLNNLRSLALMLNTYCVENDNKIFSSATAGKYGWVNHEGGLSYYNREDQLEAIKRGLLYHYGNKTMDVDIYRCPTGKRDEARTYSMPDSMSWNDLWVVMHAIGGYGNPVSEAEAKKYVVKNYDQLRPASQRMLFIDEGYCTPAPWSINYDEPRTWDPIPIRHGDGTTLSFADGHAEHWKWEDPRTVKFGRASANLTNPNDAAYWQELHDNPVNEDLRKLVYAAWGSTGPGFKQ